MECTTNYLILAKSRLENCVKLIDNIVSNWKLEYRVFGLVNCDCWCSIQNCCSRSEVATVSAYLIGIIE